LLQPASQRTPVTSAPTNHHHRHHHHTHTHTAAATPPPTQACEEEALLGHMGVVLYEYLGEEYPGG
jgi:hypothetical protein